MQIIQMYESFVETLQVCYLRVDTINLYILLRYILRTYARSAVHIH